MAANPSIQLGTDGNWAIKEDNLLAYKKDGTRFFNKEFDFTRGSLATFVDKDGLIKYSGVTDTELVTNGDFSTDSDWIKGTGWSISDGKASCDGTNITYLTQTAILSSGKSYKVQFDIVDYTSGSVKYRDNGLVGGQSFSGVGSYTDYVTAGGGQFRLMSKNFTGSIDNVSVVEIQTDVPRIDFTDDATGHLLLEPQSTNFITYSEDFSQSVWTKNDVTVASGFLAPDGTNTAYKVTENGSNAHLVGFSGQNTNKRKSIWARTVSGTGKVTLLNVTTDTNALFDITEQWQRFDITHSGADFFYAVDFRNASATLTEVLIWGAQAEALSYPTSYIPTFGSTATRNAEVCNNSGSEQDFNSEEGVLYAEISALADDGAFRSISLSNGTATNRVSIRYNTTSNSISAYIYQGTTNVFSYDKIVSDVKDFHKLAIKYKSGDISFWVDGVEVATSSLSFSFLTLTDLSFMRGDNVRFFYGKTKNLKVFKRAMSDGELYLLTVPQYQSYQEMATALNYTL